MTLSSYSQKNSIDFNLSSGISSPSSSFSDESFASDGNFFDFSATYYFSKIGAGISIGSFSNLTEGNFTDRTNSLAFPTINTTEDWKTTYYGVGPEYKTNFNRFNATFLTRIGMMAVKPIRLSGGYAIDNADFSSNVIDFGSSETSNLSYYSAGIKLGYEIIPNLSLFVKADYLSSLSKEITISERIKRISDINKNGVIDQEDFFDAAGEPIDFHTTTVSVKPQLLHYGIGLNYAFDLDKKQKTDIENAKIIVPVALNKGLRFANKENGKSISKTVKTVSFKNPLKEEKDNAQKLVNMLPKNNSHFKSTAEIEDFSWKLIGKTIANPQYIIEITKIGSNRQPQRVYMEKTTDTKIATKKVAKFKAGKALADTVKRTDNSGNSNENEAGAGEGNFMWKIIETSTGISSNPSFFSVSNCDIDFSISNDTIECLGYEGANRKFKICFDSNYQSSNGDLTYANPGSGLTVFDQSYTSLSYTLVSPNPTLLTQIGTTPTTVSYCFEVTVPNSVTSIGFGLQGDDLDPSPIYCVPGVSANFDDLPNCLCDECEDITLSFDNFNISPQGNMGNQFNFNGNINVNVPIYGIEFQIQSYSYSANPSACTAGVGGVEESGMILMPGTTINGSTGLQLFNETASGSPNSNNNATKDIKYISNAVLTGAIPVNLTIGLPGPISGLDPSCCVIDYTVCIKVKIFYDKDNCKSCVFTQCFNFNNQ